MLKQKKLLIYLFSSVGCASLIIFSMVHTIAGNQHSALVEGLAAFIALLNLVLLRFYNRVELAGSFILVLMIGVLSFLFTNGGFLETGIFWFFTFPPLAFYLKPTKQGTVWILLLISCMFLLTVMGYSFYSVTSLLPILISFIVTSCLVYFYALYNNLSNVAIRKQNEEVNNLNEQIIEELAKRSEFDNKISSKNEELEQTKKAMLNLLEDLQEEKSRDDAILESIGDGFIATDGQGVILRVNQAFEYLLGWTVDEVVGKKLASVVPMLDKNGKAIIEKKRLITQALKNKKISTDAAATIEYQRKDGRTFPVSITVAPIVQDDGTVIGAVEIFRDVTEEKRIDQAKTEFVSLASHQLRTPLTSIKWYAEMLLDGDAGELTKKQKDFLEEIYRGNQRMVELVNSLLNVSRIELGTFAIEPEPVSVRTIAQEVIKELGPSIEEKEISVKESYARYLTRYKADPRLLRIIFQNLLSNAVKYTPSKGKISLNIKRDKKNDLLHITVSDTGYGIPLQQQDQIFKKLFRADNAFKHDQTGTGLGLYIVKSIVESAEGKIWFESKEKKGTTFYITLPLSGMKAKKGSKPLEK